MECNRYAMNTPASCLAVILFISLCLGGCRAKEAAAVRSPEKTSVIVKEATCVSANDIIFVSGVLKADKTVPLSFLVPGKVDKINVDEGDHVKRGEILALVEINDYQSNLEIAEAMLLKAQDAYKRFQPLYKEGAFSEKNFIELKAGLAQAKAGRDIAQKKVNDTILRSPICGIIGAKNIEIGQMISPQRPAFIIVKIDKIYARVSIPESEIGKIKVGQKAEVTVPALEDKIIVGNVTLIGTMADPQTRTYTAEIELSNPDYILLSGMTAQAKIITDKKIDMLTVPGKAIVRDADNLTYVFVADTKTGKALRRRIYPGSVYQSEIEIKNGLAPKDAVIIAGQHKLTDGASIIIADADK